MLDQTFDSHSPIHSIDSLSMESVCSDPWFGKHSARVLQGKLSACSAFCFLGVSNNRKHGDSRIEE